MKVSELKNGQVVRYRLGRAGRIGVNWGVWENGPLYVQVCRNPEATIITPDRPKMYSWAEYTPKDFCSPTPPEKNGVLLAEDFYMEIEGLRER